MRQLLASMRRAHNRKIYFLADSTRYFYHGKNLERVITPYKKLSSAKEQSPAEGGRNEESTYWGSFICCNWGLRIKSGQNPNVLRFANAL